MPPELLLCDIGNTAIKLGLADAQGVHGSYTLPQDREQTPDSLGLSILQILRHANIAPDALCACVCASVVPHIDPCIKAAVSRYLGCACVQVPGDLPVPLKNRYERPEEVGADILVGAYAASRLYPEVKSLIVVDYGTAVTFAAVEDRAFLGGMIFPGPATAIWALAQRAAKLPQISLDHDIDDASPGRDTAACIRQGLLFGFVSLSEGLCARLKARLSGPTQIVGTGGFAQSIARHTNLFDAIEPKLLLEGLRRLYYGRSDRRDNGGI